MGCVKRLLMAQILLLVSTTATQAADPVVNGTADPVASPEAAASLDQVQQSLDPALLLHRLARPAPAETAFTERRESPLLSEPLMLSGLLQQPRGGMLIKSVQSPYAERMLIVDGTVSVEREGEKVRRFSLRRAPELVAINAGFEALLTGDIDLLKQFYVLQLHGTTDAWQLEMTPLDRRLAKRVKSMWLLGTDAGLRCIDLQQQGGEGSRMWVGDAAAAALTATDDDARDALCSHSTD